MWLSMMGIGRRFGMVPVSQSRRFHSQPKVAVMCCCYQPQLRATTCPDFLAHNAEVAETSTFIVYRRGSKVDLFQSNFRCLLKNSDHSSIVSLASIHTVRLFSWSIG